MDAFEHVSQKIDDIYKVRFFSKHFVLTAYAIFTT